MTRPAWPSIKPIAARDTYAKIWVMQRYRHADDLAALIDGLDVPIYATAGVGEVIRRDDPVKEEILRPMFGAEWPALVKAAKGHNVRAIWSHLASADEPGDPSVDRQTERFEHAYQVALAEGLAPMRHIANSATVLTRPDLAFRGPGPDPWRSSRGGRRDPGCGVRDVCRGRDPTR